MSLDIDEKTKISLFAVAFTTPFLIGGILWLAAIDAKATEAKAKIEQLTPLVIQTRDAVIRIETVLRK